MRYSTYTRKAYNILLGFLFQISLFFASSNFILIFRKIKVMKWVECSLS